MEEQIEVFDEIMLQNQPYKILALTLTLPIDNRGVYEAVRGNWDMTKDHAEQADLVFAVYKREIIGIFKPDKWEYVGPDADKLGVPRNWLRFTGREVKDPEIIQRYLGKYITKKQGESNPVRYYY